ncbi:MAG: GTP-binding protein [Candidatus Lokiarchaeota archaeon]|nr:GTP-binding protein [Candidatus Lokiarchaeota archaeon]
MTNSREYGFKISVIGDGGVGKTSLIKKFTKGTFEKDYIKTVGAQFSRYEIEIKGDVINLIFWDIAGQIDAFNFLHPLFYKESRASIIVCSLEDNNLGRDSFINVKEWYEELEKHCGNIPVVLFANKVDLVEDIDLDTTKIQNLVNEHDFLGFYLTSAKTGKGVIEAFNAIIDELYKKFKALSTNF